MPSATVPTVGAADLAVSREEPMGIVISRGRDIDVLPRYRAYAWGPIPDDLRDVEAELAFRSH
jgi:hypothetical protein